MDGGISDRLTALKAELKEAVAREQYEEAPACAMKSSASSIRCAGIGGLNGGL